MFTCTRTLNITTVDFFIPILAIKY